jgi:hypothetical protein
LASSLAVVPSAFISAKLEGPIFSPVITPRVLDKPVVFALFKLRLTIPDDSDSVVDLSIR